jgi:hypothetical protein
LDVTKYGIKTNENEVIIIIIICILWQRLTKKDAGQMTMTYRLPKIDRETCQISLYKATIIGTVAVADLSFFA